MDVLFVEFKPSPRRPHPRRTAPIDRAITALVRAVRQRQLRSRQCVALPCPALDWCVCWYVRSRGWTFRVVVQWQQLPDAAFTGRVDVAWEP
jgi:hypothetical protein